MKLTKIGGNRRRELTPRQHQIMRPKGPERAWASGHCINSVPLELDRAEGA